MPDRGSATMLLPAAMLLMVALGAIAVDLSHLHAARAALQNRADAAANDAVTAGLDPIALRSGEGYRLDPRRVEQAARRAARSGPTGGLGHLDVDVAIVGPRSVAVDVSGTVELLFAPALPGGPARVHIRATAGARAEVR